jgi:hypothetical protein
VQARSVSPGRQRWDIIGVVLARVRVSLNSWRATSAKLVDVGYAARDVREVGRAEASARC